MKYQFLFLVFAFIATNAQDKVIKDFSVDSDGKIHYEKVVNVDGKTKDELFTKSKLFFVNSFKSANNVIQMEDREQGIIVGKGNTTYAVNAGMGVVSSGRLNFTIKIQSKDGRYKYEIYNLSFDGGTYDTPAEGWFMEKTYYKKNGKPKQISERYKDATVAAMTSLELSIVESMKSDAAMEAKKEGW